MASEAMTQWAIKGTGYEFCNCDYGCGCNFGGFPNSDDGSCRALVGVKIDSGTCGDVNLSGVKCAAIVSWPKAIHEGNGKAAFVVDPSTTEAQTGALAQIFTGQLGGMPWEILGPTFEVVGLETAAITIEGSGPKTTFRAEGIAECVGDPSRTPSPATTTSPRCTSPTASSGRVVRSDRDPQGVRRRCGDSGREQELDPLRLRLVESIGTPSTTTGRLARACPPFTTSSWPGSWRPLRPA